MFRSSSLPSTRKKSLYNRSKNELGSSKRLAADRTPSFRLRVHELGPASKSRKTTGNDVAASAVAATSFLKSREEEEDDDDGQFGKNFGEEGWSNDNDDKSMWLSSGTLSPSSCFTDRRFSVILDPSLDEWLVSFRPSSLGDQIKSPDSPSFHLERWVSSVGDDSSSSKWISELGSETIEFSGSSGLISSSSGVVLIHEEESQVFLSPSEYVPEDFDLSDVGSDEPLFWPFDKKSVDWSSPESKWDLFIMSPRKVARKNESTTSAELIHLRNYDSKEGYMKRKMVLSSSGSKSSKVLKMKQPRANGVKEMKRTKTMPSRLGNPNQPPESSVKIVPLDQDEEVGGGGGKILVSQNSMVRYGNNMDYDFPLKEELAIETLMGLDEFDGHEGIDSGFNKDHFSFDNDSL